MSLPHIIMVRDAVVAEMNAHTFDPSFVAVGRILPKYDLEALDQVSVDVVPGGMEIETLTRAGTTKDDPIIDIAVLKRVSDVETDVPPLMKLVEDILEFWKPRRSSNAGRLIEITIPTIYSPDHLRTKNLFISVIRLRFGRVS